MPREQSLHRMLQGGDRRSLGQADEVLRLLRAKPQKIAELVNLLWDTDPVVRMRAADVTEKLSIDHAEWLQSYKAELLGMMEESLQQEVRWHLALIVPRLALSQTERRKAAVLLERYLEDRSSIVKTFAMQGLWDLSSGDAAFREAVADRVLQLTKTGTAAMRARGRKLLNESGIEKP